MVRRTGRAVAQDRPDVLRRREGWFEGRHDLDPNGLIYIYETCTAKTNGRCHRCNWVLHGLSAGTPKDHNSGRRVEPNKLNCPNDHTSGSENALNLRRTPDLAGRGPTQRLEAILPSQKRGLCQTGHRVQQYVTVVTVQPVPNTYSREARPVWA